jgi:hypothetical protein
VAGKKTVKPRVVEVDPVAAWRAGPAIDLGFGAAVETVIEDVPDTPEELAGVFCTHCGERSTGVARFCFACGSAMHPAPVAGAGVAVEMAASVTTRPDLNQFRPKPEADLTPEEKQRRQQEHAAAIAAGQKDPPLRYVPSQDPRKVLIHIVEDGFTWAGQVWMRGQELEIGPDHPRWADAQRWINMSDFEQMDRYGKIRFRKGPWPGRRSYADGAGSFEPVILGQGEGAQKYQGPSVKELLEADQRERARGRAVPAPTF